jgi:predicted metal-dependent peptidase
LSTEGDRKIAKVRIAMVFDTPFYGLLALNLEIKEGGTSTMATDGKNLFYDSAFVMGLNLEYLKAVVAHEVTHIVLWHLPRAQGRDPEGWNIAADLADNYLVAQDFTLPPGVLIPPPELENKTVEYIYAKLPTKPKGSLLDDHGKWKDWGQEAAIDQGGIEQAWREKVAQAANAARSQGKLPGHLGSVVDGILQPKLSWQALLTDFVTSSAKNDFRLSPPNKKHIWRGFILPSLQGEEIKVGLGIDTSGSVGHNEKVMMMSEVKGICEQYENHTLYLWVGDSSIARTFEIHEFDPLPTNLEGGGGTDFRPIIEAAEKSEASCLIYFTDLAGVFPETPPRIPVIWVCIAEGAKAPFGTVIYCPREDGQF